MNSIKRRWRALPKWLRFTLHYGTMPLWAPILLPTLFVIWLVCASIALLINAWKDYK